MIKKPTLFLLPSSLGESDFDAILPQRNKEIINSLKYFIVEDVRTARRFLKKVNSQIDIDSLTFSTLNQHTTSEELSTFLRPMFDGNNIGLLSEAGCPAIADPGAEIVAMAQENNFTIVPLVGPSSILLALMASGFNGQSFAFVGYLPIQKEDRSKTIKKLETRVYAENQSQLFIETPYRNMKMLDELIKTLQPNTKLCIAADITLPTEFIKTKTIKDWKSKLPDLEKRPCIFIIYK